jgi:hypothetical protein
MEKSEILQMALATIESKDKRIEKLQERVKELERVLDNNNGFYNQVRNSITDAENRRWYKQLLNNKET